MQTNPEDEKDDPVWQLLDQARPVKPSPFFSRNVVREVRQLRDNGAAESWWTRWLRPATANVAFATLAVAALAIFLVSQSHQNQAGDSSDGQGTVVQVPSVGDSAELPAVPRATEFDPAAEIGNLEYLGQLMAVTDPSALDDNALADLLF